MAYEKVSGSSSSSPRTPHPRAQPNGDKDSFTWFQDVRITPRFENQEPPSHFEKWIGKSHDSHDTNETRSLFGSPMSFFGRMEGGKISSNPPSSILSTLPPLFDNDYHDNSDSYVGDVDPRNQFDTWLREDDDDKSPGTPNSERSFKSGLSVFSTDTPVMRPMVTDSLFDSESDSERAPWDSDYDDEDDDDEEDCDEGDYSVTAEEIPRPAYKAVTDSRLSLPSWRPALPLSLSEVPDALSSFIIESSAEMGSRVKQTPIPNALSYLASHVLSLAYTLDDKLDIYDKSVQLLESLIRVWIWICTVSVTAGIRFFVAYQTTPPSPKPMPQRIVPVEQLRRRPSKGKGKLEPADASYASKSVSNGMIASVVGPVASSLLGWVPTLSLLNSTLPSSRTAPCSTSQDEPSLPPGTIQLSVGGFPFATTSQTLQSASGSYFSRLVSDQTTSRRRSPDNQIVFIDRDGTHFRHILNHLRGTDSITGIKDKAVLHEILKESDFYGLQQLSQKLKHRLGIVEPEPKPVESTVSWLLRGVARAVIG